MGWSLKASNHHKWTDLKMWKVEQYTLSLIILTISDTDLLRHLPGEGLFVIHLPWHNTTRVTDDTVFVSCLIHFQLIQTVIQNCNHLDVSEALRRFKILPLWRPTVSSSPQQTLPSICFLQTQKNLSSVSQDAPSVCIIDLSTSNSWEPKPAKLPARPSGTPGQTLAAWAPLTTSPLLAIVVGHRLHAGVGPSWSSSLEPIGPPLPPSALQGLPDFTYRERVWSPGSPGFWWSPSASFLAYVVFPCTQVLYILTWGYKLCITKEAEKHLTQTDCETVVIAGQTLPHLSLHVAAFVKNKVASDNASQNNHYKVEGTTQVLLRLRTRSSSTQVSLLDPSSHYLASVCWASSTRLVVRLVERRHVLDIIATMLLFIDLF